MILFKKYLKVLKICKLILLTLIIFFHYILIINNILFRTIKNQLAFLLGRQRAFSFEEEDDDLGELIGNMKLADYYLELARDLSVEEPKAPKDIYKMHLIENRHCMNTFFYYF